jgi:tyrosyl-tRNA synthetase
MLTEVQIKTNLKTYFAQAFKILDKSKTETHYNSKWLKKLGFAEIGTLADLFGVGDFTSREIIKKRLDAGKRVSVRELLYPLMQGYDSVAVKADVELGGTDQRYNLLAGRKIQEQYKQKPQDILMVDLLEGTDGRKMSSSWGNVINIYDAPHDMFGKVMSIHDSLIEKYFVYATNIPEKEIKTFLQATKHPRDQKLQLAESITALYHGAKAAVEARQSFIAQFSNNEVPDEIPTKKLVAAAYQVSKLLVTLGLAESNSAARRLIEQKGVRFNQEVVAKDGTVHLERKQELLVQVGKRKFVKVSIV